MPANGYTSSSFQTLAPVTGTLSINSSTCAGTESSGQFIAGELKTGAGSKQACVMAIQELTITASGKIQATGGLPLVLIVKKDASIEGLIDAGAHGKTPGPGGGTSGCHDSGSSEPGGGPGGGQVCKCISNSSDDCGGGGGGHALPGGQGGTQSATCTPLPKGGAANGSDTLSPLVGGSGGGSRGQASPDGWGCGGAGGGALQISCGGALVVDGTINAGGGGGESGGQPDAHGGGGGGSGGAILLEAASINGDGIVAVNGGGGGAGGGTFTNCDNTQDGEDGKASTAVAKGGLVIGPCGAGGDGGTGFVPAADGKTEYAAGGGGGGAVGRIRFNWYKHATIVPIKSSGMASTGEVTAQ